MNRLKKSLLRGLAIFAGLLLLAVILFYFRFRDATRAMTPAETGAINDSVWCVKDKYVNAYIFRGNSGYILFDAGIGKRNFKKQLEKTGIEPGMITTIFLTHADGDHIGAIGLFKNPVIYMHKDEEQMVNGTRGKMKYFKPVWKFGPYRLLSGNDSLVADGIKIKILHTPGHTPGSSCFRVGDEYLVSGDNLVVSDGKFGHFVEMFNMNTPEQVESLKALPDIGEFSYILTGHHGIVRNTD